MRNLIEADLAILFRVLRERNDRRSFLREIAFLTPVIIGPRRAFDGRHWSSVHSDPVGYVRCELLEI